MTVSQNCVLGAELCASADEQALTKGYGIFAAETKNIKKDYQPKSVNIDGWEATNNAFSTLFSGIIIIYCFLHGAIKIRDRCRKSPWFDKICGHVWHVYRAETKKAFAQRIRRLKEWTKAHVSEKSGVFKKIDSLCSKSSLYQRYYDHPESYRTSNMIDRIMDSIDRSLFSRRYLHGTFKTASKTVRSWAILYNYYPYCLRKTGRKNTLTCAASELNGFVYSSNWLENLIIASSMNGYRH